MSDDLIRRSDAIEAVWKPQVKPNELIFDALKRAIESEINNLPSADRPKGWIPCSERMPNEKERVESYIRNKRASEFIVMIKGANRPTTLYLSWDNYWFDDNNDFYEVVAWMPLPDTRSGQDNENA